MSSEAGAGSEDTTGVPPSYKPAHDLVNALYVVRDTFFPEDVAVKEARLAELTAGAVAAVDDVPVEEVAQATACYLRGKALSVGSKYDKDAEQMLSKAVKLDPGNIDAWNVLGECFWKKGDLVASRDCYENALAQAVNADSLCLLSMLLRQLGSTPEEKTANIKMSVEKAKAAVALNVRDGKSWYILGNAHLSLFFTEAHDPTSLKFALTAYSRAADNGAQDNPDLAYNQATVLDYLEDYQQAFDGLLRAKSIDPSLPAASAMDSLTRHVARVHDLVTRKGRVKPKRLSALVATLPDAGKQARMAAAPAADGRAFVGIRDLEPGPNPGKMLLLKLAISASQADHIPAVLVMVDGNVDSVAVSLYHLDSKALGALSDKDVFIVLDPVVKDIKFDLPASGVVEYCTIQVGHPDMFICNGRSLASSFAPAALDITAFS